MTHSIGIFGAGNISARYVEGIHRRFPGIHIGRVADVDLDRAASLAREYGIPAWGSPEELLADPSIDVIVNLTPPALHASTVISALNAGKNVYVEKPLAPTLDEGKRMLQAAVDNQVLLGSAPDTFLGSASQTAREAIAAGAIGEPIGATAFVRSSRAETWHPNPAFLFQPGGGPVMDLGPYYFASLVNCLGPVASVAASARVGELTRVVTAPGKTVDSIDVTVNTHASGVLTFVNGAIGTVMMSFDVWDTDLPFIEIYGTRGTLSLHDPNEFDGPVRIKRHGDEAWQEIEPVVETFGSPGPPEQWQRGIGVADLIGALDGGRHAASGAFALHVLDIMLAIEESSSRKELVTLMTSDELIPTAVS